MADKRRSWHYLGTGTSFIAEFEISIARTRKGEFYVYVGSTEPDSSGELFLGNVDEAFEYIIQSNLPLNDCLNGIMGIRGFRSLTDLLRYEIETENIPAITTGKLTCHKLSTRQSREKYGAGLSFVGSVKQP